MDSAVRICSFEEAILGPSRMGEPDSADDSRFPIDPSCTSRLLDEECLILTLFFQQRISTARNS